MMLIEYIKDCKDDRPGRWKTIPKGKIRKVTKEYGLAEIKAKRAKDVTEKMEQFNKEVLTKNIENDGDN